MIKMIQALFAMKEECLFNVEVAIKCAILNDEEQISPHIQSKILPLPLLPLQRKG